jgi:hypothetical protein
MGSEIFPCHQQPLILKCCKMSFVCMEEGILHTWGIYFKSHHCQAKKNGWQANEKQWMMDWQQTPIDTKELRKKM